MPFIYFCGNFKASEMKILLLGSGGREHALAWKMKQSKLCAALFIAPGNAGTAALGTNLPIDVNNFEAQLVAVLEHQIDMIVVGPEDPLVNGVYDYFKSNPATAHVKVIGPSAQAAQLEGSKAFAKAFMSRHKIPTAAYAEFTSANYQDGLAYLKQHALPIVLKADGLAAGKGVVICTDIASALQEFEEMIQQSKFGAASAKVVVEQFLDGIELSVFALTDGENYVLLPEAKDYKRIGLGDTGLNTGGMGTVSPLPFATKNFMQKVAEKIVKPTIDGFKKEGYLYEGFVFFGLIKVGEEPMVIEYNCRMGDPETETVLMRLENDLVALLDATAMHDLHNQAIDISPNAVATIVAVSGGYPEAYEKNKEINGLEMAIKDAKNIIFHCGTKQQGNQVLSNGGRVLAATSSAATLQEAVVLAKQQLAKISFEGMYFRSDIGYEFE